MFLNITVGIGCAGVIFHSYKPTGKVTGTFIKLAAALAGKKEYSNSKQNIFMNKVLHAQH